MKILHVLNHSVPHTDGYCVRSEQIVRFQAAMGLEPVVVTSPRHEPIPTAAMEEIGGVRYYRSVRASARHIPVLSDAWLAWRFARTIAEVVQAERPDLIHCHSPCRWGLAALRVARRHRLPCVYEIRGFWEDSAVDQGMMRANSLKYAISRRLETRVARRADAVVTIAQAMKSELVGRGIDEAKVFLVVNGIDPDVSRDVGGVAELAARLGLTNGRRIGYVGSLYPWEGVDDLIQAVPRVLAEVPDTEFIIVGGGSEAQRLRELAAASSGTERIHLTGPVPRDEVAKYYALLDILVYPRKSTRTTELTTPLKPLEAMALAKPVLGSDVGGIRELLVEGTGAMFRAGDATDLAAQCVHLIRHDGDRQQMAERGLRYVYQSRCWDRLIVQYEAVYAHASRNAAFPADDVRPAEPICRHS